MGEILRSKFSEAEARELTDEIKADYGALQVKIAAAWRGRVWLALGYESWQDYLDGEFSDVSIRPPKELELQVVQELRDAGMSTRGISAATNLSKGTVDNRLRTAGAQNWAPDTPERGTTPPPVVGLDGKEYAQPAPRRPAEEIHDAEIVDDDPGSRPVSDLGLDPIPVDLSGRPAFGPEKVNGLIRELHEGGAAALPMARKRAANLEMAFQSGQVDVHNLDRVRLEALGADLADAAKVLAGLLSTLIHEHPDWQDATAKADGVDAMKTTARILRELTGFLGEEGDR